MIEFLRTFENRGFKIAPVNTILITKSINLKLFTLILYGVGVRCDVVIFKPTASAQSIYREFSGITYLDALFSTINVNFLSTYTISINFEWILSVEVNYFNNSQVSDYFFPPHAL